MNDVRSEATRATKDLGGRLARFAVTAQERRTRVFMLFASGEAAASRAAPKALARAAALARAGLSLLGLYDQAILFKSLPARLLKLCFYQRWLDVSNLSKVLLEIRGEPLGNTVLRVNGIPSESEPKGVHPARITLVIGPIDIMREGRLEFLTYFNEESSPSHTHQVQIGVDPELKLS